MAATGTTFAAGVPRRLCCGSGSTENSPFVPPKNVSLSLTRSWCCDSVSIQHSPLVRPRNFSLSLTRTPKALALQTVQELSSNDDVLEEVDPDFFRMGYQRYMRAYGVEFKEGPKGIGVYAAKDFTKLKTARVIMEIPIELMITLTKDPPWLFFPDFVPMGHPVFDIINATDAEKDWDLRLTCLLLLALDQKDHFWQMYSEYLPGTGELSSLLLASEEDKLELHHKELEELVDAQKKRAVDFWKQHWRPDSVLKLKRLAFDEDQFLWALGVIWSRKFLMTISLGAKPLDALMLIPYADMVNHSFKPNCSYRWRKNDRMLEVVMNRGETIMQGEEMTFDYAPGMTSDALMQFYGFSSEMNPFEVVNFSGNAKIHQDSFLSAFDFSGVSHDFDFERASMRGDGVFDGGLVASARNLPMWSDEDLPFLPSEEIKAARALKQECKEILETCPTTLEEDYEILESGAGKSAMWQAAVKYRMDRKRLIARMMDTLDLYAQRILV